MNTCQALLDLENELTFSSFNNDDALALGLLFVKQAQAMNSAVAIFIEKNHQPLFQYLMAGTTQDNILWMHRKKNVVDHFLHSSRYVEELYKQMGAPFTTSLLDPLDYQAVGGSFPLIVKGAGVVGSITISGFTGEEDHQFCVQGIRQYLKGGQ